MNFVELVGVYGPLGAAIIGAVVWFAKIYIERLRPERIARENRLLEAFEKNTEAITKHTETMHEVKETMREMKDAISEIKEDLAALFAKIDVPRPSRLRRDEVATKSKD
jgi:hypothetical protein